MWNMKCVITPVTVRAPRVVEKKGLKRNLEAIRGKRSLESLQKTVVHEKFHIIRKVLQSET